jgi:hypothetical protein
MYYNDDDFICSKEIVLSCDCINYKYRVTAKKDFDLLKYNFPILLFDGRARLIQIETEKNVFAFEFGNQKYKFTCPGMEDSYTSLERLLCSTSGLTTFMECIIKRDGGAGEEFKFEIQLERIGLYSEIPKANE